MQQNWFQSWFNSPYYHILYSGRNEKEAEFLIDNLTAWLAPDPGSAVLDIACGKGRHAIYLHDKGFDVTGIDLAPNSISYARQFETNRLHFFVHDMRKLFYINYFDLSLNLFTSFGYFNSNRENLKALNAFAKGLKPNGILVIDYLNVQKVLREMKPSELKSVQGIDFHIRKSLAGGKIIKNIQFTDNGESFSFSEQVQAITLPDFTQLLGLAGLKIIQTFGNYQLDQFDPNNSDRLLLICSKQ